MDNAKEVFLQARISAVELAIVNQMAQRLNLSKSEVVRRAIARLYNEVSTGRRDERAEKGDAPE